MAAFASPLLALSAPPPAPRTSLALPPGRPSGAPCARPGRTLLPTVYDPRPAPGSTESANLANCEVASQLPWSPVNYCCSPGAGNAESHCLCPIPVSGIRHKPVILICVCLISLKGGSYVRRSLGGTGFLERHPGTQASQWQSSRLATPPSRQREAGRTWGSSNIPRREY